MWRILSDSPCEKHALSLEKAGHAAPMHGASKPKSIWLSGTEVPVCPSSYRAIVHGGGCTQMCAPRDSQRHGAARTCQCTSATPSPVVLCTYTCPSLSCGLPVGLFKWHAACGLLHSSLVRLQRFTSCHRLEIVHNDIVLLRYCFRRCS